MTTITTVETEALPEDAADYSEEMILAACVIIALLFFLVGLRWLRRRRRRHEGDHLVADIAEPETMADREGDRTGGRGGA